ncbi:Hormonally up-regulated neu tumor-associated kinase [Holothuria leucospilota]|uniref:non-specific serine/threonine protein kinase n=1 Tax=Holothuria leucospilota TaxID=206669 RepID=A0A9Q1BJ24_HOLLE|nr:Hormonally up-regulated neu tumor-associated kinase [Holothuria leucospilota]
MKTRRKVNNTAKQMLLPTLTSYRSGEASGYNHSKRVGPYLIGRLLGEGSFAKVREAMHTVVGEKVAIKIIDKKEAQTDFYIHKHLRREAAILQQLRHPNIVALLEVLETDNNLYMVLEICNGGPLLDLIWVQQGLSEDDAKRFTQQVISAVQYLHNVGIMHRDLKVENMLLDEDKNIKLIDFGLSSFHLPTCEALAVQSVSTFYDHTISATLCGSPAYAAPEIISQKSYSPKVDVWSIGINTFAMLTATLPFLVEPFNLRLLLRKMLNGQMSELPPNVSKG